MKSSEINSVMKKYPLFQGVFPCDMIPLIEGEGGLIVNTDNSKEKGTHWVALYTNGDGNILYFDSFGLPPIVYEIIIYIKKFRECTYNTVQIQDIYSSDCGELCIAFLIYMFKGHSMAQFSTLAKKYLYNKM